MLAVASKLLIVQVLSPINVTLLGRTDRDLTQLSTNLARTSRPLSSDQGVERPAMGVTLALAHKIDTCHVLGPVLHLT